MGKYFKVKILTNCEVCGLPITATRYRSYCSTTCRNKFYNVKYRKQQQQWQRVRRDKLASVPSADKCRCLVCGKFYVQVGSHVFAVHKMTARKYREQFELEVKRGITPNWYRELKGNQAINNGTYRNLKAGEKFRFKEGDKVGNYKRSPVTLERLKNLNKFNKINKKYVETSIPNRV